MKSLATIKLFIFSLVLTNILQKNKVTAALPVFAAKLFFISKNPSKVQKLRLNPAQWAEYRAQHTDIEFVNQQRFNEMKACPFCLDQSDVRRTQKKSVVVEKCVNHRWQPLDEQSLLEFETRGFDLVVQAAEIEIIPYSAAEASQEEGPSSMSAPIVSEKLMGLVPFSSEASIKQELTTPTNTSAKLGTIAFFIASAHMGYCLSKKIYRFFRPSSTEKELQKIKEQLDSLQNGFLSTEESNRF